MCRLFAYSGDFSNADFETAIKEFSKLGQDGCVPCGVPKGHLDGWGIHASTDKDEVYFRSVEPVTETVLINAATPIMSGVGTAIIHLRKATVGKNELCNTHPFLRSGISFCHNGSIRAFPDTSFTGDRELREGHTDSETFFLRIIDQIKGQVGDASSENITAALQAEISEIEKTSTWTSLTCLLKTKEGVILNYLWNESHPEAEKMEFEKYYSFYVGKKGDATILCSEKLNVEGVAWEKLQNGTTLLILI